MRLNALQYAGLFALLLLATPVWAHTDSATLESNGDVTIAGTQLKAGEYQLKVENNADQLQVTQDGKVITKVPVKWVQLPNKAANTEVDINANQIVEVDFAGKTQAVKIQAD
jgi:uncharacterized membrane protein YcaP (DUF421 family)